MISFLGELKLYRQQQKEIETNLYKRWGKMTEIQNTAIVDAVKRAAE
ncbi:hypothetical protein [Thermoactinomyces mirandus]|uniref:Uncharacterized protein n=1 Tax=Thermoactinomyces mirandus TaxID=2756294 RepID=A0A7W1XQ79_9BACL|nr:hypothetical protein [Thermoactinomyces mirandus]MBA4601151.1 hypothetical protein [Thermoactinomyces mirandus]